jgi:hypothetical protein
MTTTPALGGALRIDVRLGADVDEYSGTVSAYDDRGPLSGFLLHGEHVAGVQLNLSTSCEADPALAEVEAVAAERFAAWATQHATAARAHANRVARQPLSGGGAMCPCGARMTWAGDLDHEALADWDVAHQACEPVNA